MNTVQEFHDFINYSALVVLPLRGREFTWSRSGGEAVCSRLDRFLVSVEWKEQFPDSFQNRLPRPLSDHYPLTLGSKKMVRGKVPFKFENMWLKAEGITDLIKKWWEEVEVTGFASFVLASKLKVVKEELKIWNREVFGDVRLKKFSLLGSINALDAKEESVGLSSEDVDRRRREREELGRVLQLEEISWRQKSRALWLKEGDRNTRFFHRTTNSRRRFNFMASVVVDGIRCESIENLKNSVQGFFRELFTENEPWRPKVDGLLLPGVICKLDI